MAVCTDKVVGDILAGWRYDISGLAPEMREDYEAHFRDCARCRGKRKLHRIIDFSLMLIASASGAVFLLALLAIRHFNPARAVLLEIIAACGAAFSAMVWIIVAVSTPVPVVVAGVALAQARRIHEKLPEEVKSRIPEKISSKIVEEPKP
jgi:hypothetical protein